MNVAALLTKAAKSSGDRVALKYQGVEITYRELDRSTARLASAFRELGLRSGDRLILWMRNRPELVVALFAAFKAGLTAVPVNLRLHPAEVAYIARNCGASALYFDESLDAEAAAVLAEAGSALSGIRADGLRPSATPMSPVESAPTDNAWLFYTSGTTGKPKGATLSHANLLAMTMSCLADIYSFQPEDTVLHAAPLTHGSGLYLLASIARGSANVISAQSTFDASDVFRTIEQERITAIAFAAPTMIVRLINEPSIGNFDLSSLRCVIYGGAPMYIDHMKRALQLFGPIFAQVYGQGETPMTGTYLRREDHVLGTPIAERRLGSIGIARTDVEVDVVDPVGQRVADGEVGEIVVRGDTVMSGYWEDPVATAASLRGGWLHTGDLGYRDEDGYFFLVDRAKDMIISGGNNIYAREVEEAILTHPKVREVAVFGVPSREWGESVHAVVVLHPGESMDGSEIQEHCRSQIASYKKPSSVDFIEELPKNAYGKILKRELRERHWGNASRQIAGGAIAEGRGQ